MVPVKQVFVKLLTFLATRSGGEVMEPSDAGAVDSKLARRYFCFAISRAVSGLKRTVMGAQRIFPYVEMDT